MHFVHVLPYLNPERSTFVGHFSIVSAWGRHRTYLCSSGTQDNDSSNPVVELILVRHGHLLVRGNNRIEYADDLLLVRSRCIELCLSKVSIASLSIWVRMMTGENKRTHKAYWACFKRSWETASCWCVVKAFVSMSTSWRLTLTWPWWVNVLTLPKQYSQHL